MILLSRNPKRSNLLLIACLVLTAASIATAFAVASKIDLDYWDSFNFLTQARRLSDPSFSFLALDLQRPRALILLLAGLNFIWKMLFNEQYPSLHAYHFLMVFCSLFALRAMYLLGRELFGIRVALLSLILFTLQQMFIHYAMVVMTDILSLAFFSLTLYYFLIWSGRFRFSPDSSTKVFVALVLSGAMASLSKNHFFFLLPSVLASWIVATYVQAFIRRKPVQTNIIVPSVRVFLYWGITCDLLLRLSAGSQVGMVKTLWAIFLQAKGSLFHTPFLLYIQNFFVIYGPLTTGLMLFSLFSLIFRTPILTWLKRPENIGLGVVIFVTIVYFGINQIYPYKETRYLLPFLAPFLIFVSAATLRFFDDLPRWGRRAWIGLWVLSLCHPLWRSYQEAHTYFSDPQYRVENTNLNGLWNFLGSPSASGRTCKRIYACWYSIDPKNPVSLPDDTYYSNYDLGPQYVLGVQKPATIRPCFNVSGSAIDVVQRHLVEKTDLNSCYAVRRINSDSSEYLQAMRPLGAVNTQAEVDKMVVGFASPISVSCERSGKGPYSCFETQDFLKHGGPKNENKIASLVDLITTD